MLVSFLIIFSLYLHRFHRAGHKPFMKELFIGEQGVVINLNQDFFQKLQFYPMVKHSWREQIRE